MNQDRDPVNPARLGPLVTRALAAETRSPEVQEAAAKDLFDELLAQGVLTPAEHGDAYLAAFGHRDGVDHAEVLFGDDGELLVVTANGGVEYFAAE